MKLLKNKWIIIGGIVTIFIIVLVCTFFYLNKINSVDSYVNNFMKYMKNANCDKLYELSDKPSGIITTKEIYLKKCSAILTTNPIKEYHIDDISYKENYYLAQISYINSQNENNKLELKIEKNGKKLLLFNNWKSDYHLVPYLTDIKFTMSNSKADLLLDGINIPHETNEDNQEIYNVGNMYKGEYNAIIKYSDNYSYNMIINTDTTDFKLPQFSTNILSTDELNQIKKYINETEQYISTNMYDRKNFDNARFPEANNEYIEYYNSEVKYYKSIRSYAYIDHYKIKEIKIISVDLIDNGNIKVKFEEKHSFRLNYVASEYYNYDDKTTYIMELKKINGIYSLVNNKFVK